MTKSKIIPYGRQTIEADDIEAVKKVLTSDFLTQGPAIVAFEQAIAKYCSVSYAVAFSSGTAALHAACFAARVGPSDEVITTPLTFAASANCVLYCGGKVVFADLQKDIPLIDHKEIQKKVTKKTKVIIPVDYSGMPADYDEIVKIAQKTKTIIIADAAHSLGATYKEKRVGQVADMTVFSFHPVKTITTGEGGMVVTNKKSFYERLLLFRTHGITKDKSHLERKNEGVWYYEMQELGFNYRLTDIQAALGFSQAKKIDRFVIRRTEIATLYSNAFSSTDIEYLKIPVKKSSAWHLYPILLSKNIIKHKSKIVADLHDQGIKVQVHYIPVHMHPYYTKNFSYKLGDFPNTENYYSRELSLPIFPQLTNREVKKVIDAVLKTIRKNI